MPIFCAARVRLPSVSFKRANDQLFLGVLHRQIISLQQLAFRRRAAAAHRRRQVARGNLLAAAQHHRVLDGRAQLAHVARPGIIHQRFERVRREIVHRFAVFLREFAQKTLRQQRNVARPLAQRRQFDFHHAQPEKQIFAEFPGFDQFFQIFIRRRNQPHVGRQGLVRADALKRPLAEKPQQLHLDRRVNLADFVQKQRAALRLLEPPDAPLVRAGERAFFVAEQFAFQQRRRQRRAMHRHERLLRARTQLVHRLGDQFLARAAFARASAPSPASARPAGRPRKFPSSPAIRR